MSVPIEYLNRSKTIRTKIFIYDFLVQHNQGIKPYVSIVSINNTKSEVRCVLINKSREDEDTTKTFPWSLEVLDLTDTRYTPSDLGDVFFSITK